MYFYYLYTESWCSVFKDRLVISRLKSILSASSWLQRTTKEVRAFRVKLNGNQTAASFRRWILHFTRVLW